MAAFERMLSVFLAAATLCGSLAQSQAQSFPSRPLQMIVPFAPGGASDMIARTLSSALGNSLKQPVIVENRAGGGGLVAASLLAKSEPSGHTLLIVTSETLAVRFKNDFAPVGMIATSPFVLVTSGDQLRSIKDIVAGAKRGTVKFAVTNLGSRAALDNLQKATGTQFAAVQFKAPALGIASLVKQEVQAAFVSPPLAIAYTRQSKVRPLGITSRRRLPTMPDVPTLPELNLPQAVFEQWAGLVAPSRTPAPVIGALNQALLSALKIPEVAARLISIGYTPAPSSPPGFSKAVNSAGGFPICGNPCPEECRSACSDIGCCTVHY